VVGSAQSLKALTQSTRAPDLSRDFAELCHLDHGLQHLAVMGPSAPEASQGAEAAVEIQVLQGEVQRYLHLLKSLMNLNMAGCCRETHEECERRTSQRDLWCLRSDQGYGHANEQAM
jgi:hypothetical protein